MTASHAALHTGFVFFLVAAGFVLGRFYEVAVHRLASPAPAVTEQGEGTP